MQTCYASALLPLIAITVANAAERHPIANSPEVLRFIRSAGAVYVFPVTTPLKPQRDDRHMRLLTPEARRAVVNLLGNHENWWHGLYTIALAEPLPTKIGLVFRNGRDELVLFSDSETVEGEFHGMQLGGLLDDGPKKQLEAWKRQYAERELMLK